MKLNRTDLAVIYIGISSILLSMDSFIMGWFFMLMASINFLAGVFHYKPKHPYSGESVTCPNNHNIVWQCSVPYSKNMYCLQCEGLIKDTPECVTNELEKDNG